MVQHLHICQALRLGRCHTVLYCLFPADSVGSNFTGWEVGNHWIDIRQKSRHQDKQCICAVGPYDIH